MAREHRQEFGLVEAFEDFLRRCLRPYIVPSYAQGSENAGGWPLEDAQLRIAVDDAGARIELKLKPRRAGGAFGHFLEASLPIVLPAALTAKREISSGGREHTQATGIVFAGQGVPIAAASLKEIVEAATGRDDFVRHTFMAETAIRNGRLEAATLILEELAERIERHRLDEWESPKLVGHVWDLLHRCYALRPASGDERSGELFRKLCKLNPERAIE